MTPEFGTPQYWIALGEIIGVNIVLSGDNAVVIALAARSLPKRQQTLAIVFGSLAAIVMRVILTIAAVELLTLPWLRLVGSLLLLWIGVKLLVPDDADDAHGSASDHLLAAIRTILIADLVMSLDNVLGVAAAAKGSIPLLIIGLAISIPLIVFGSALILKIMDRFPLVITLGAGLLGYVAGEMMVGDKVVVGWLGDWIGAAHYVVPAAGAVLVIAVGLWLKARAESAAPPAEEQKVVDLSDEARGK